MLVQHCGEFDLYTTQSDHAVLSAELAKHLRFDVSPELLEAIAKHDDGWDRVDVHPTLLADGKCSDVFDCPWRDGLTAWRGSVEPLDGEPAVQLLVSVHVHHLAAGSLEKHGGESVAAGFELNRFVQNQIELQDRLRDELGFATTGPRHLGIAVNPTTPLEKRLRDDYLIFRGMDLLSLCLLRDEAHEQTLLLPGDVQCDITWREAGVLQIGEGAFIRSNVQIEVPARQLPHRKWPSAGELSETLRDVPVESRTVRVQTK